MRQMKQFLKQKKGLWRCGDCKCLTLMSYKCLDELCRCGEENNNSINPNIQPSPAPAPAPVEPDIIDDDNNDNDPDYISLDELNS